MPRWRQDTFADTKVLPVVDLSPVADFRDTRLRQQSNLTGLLQLHPSGPIPVVDIVGSSSKFDTARVGPDAEEIKFEV